MLRRDFRAPGPALAKLFAPFYDQRDDAPLGAWLSGHDVLEVGSLLDSNLRESAQARVMLILLTPNVSWLPFNCPEPLLHGAYSETPNLGRLSERVLRFALAVISTLRENRAHAVQVQKACVGKRRQSPWNNPWNGALRSIDYHGYLLELTWRLRSATDRDRAFEELMATSTSLFVTTKQLLVLSEVAEKYKCAADRRLRESITSLLAGDQSRYGSVVRLPSEYAAMVSGMITSPGGAPYSSSLIDEQIRFLLGLRLPGAFHTFFADTMMEVFSIIEDGDLAKQLAEGYVMGGLECPGGGPCPKTGQILTRLGRMAMDSTGQVDRRKVEWFSEQWTIEIQRRRIEVDWEPGHPDIPDPAAEMLKGFAPEDAELDYCGRLVADDAAGMEFAWSLLELTQDAEVRAVLMAIIGDSQQPLSDTDRAAVRRATFDRTQVRRLMEP
jgi:hypothetical protein